MVLLAATLLLGQTLSIPAGGYTLEDLCKRLSAASGARHSLGPDLEDYSVFLSVKDPSVTRLEKLVATAFDSEWKSGADGFVLTKSKLRDDLDFAEFSREATAALAKGKLSHLPLHDLYALAPGTILRYGSETNDFVNPLPEGVGAGARSTQVKVRRTAFGNFEFSYQGSDGAFGPFDPEGSISFSSVPDSVVALLKDDGNKAVAGSARPSGSLFEGFKGQDPLLSLVSEPLKKVAELVQEDLVLALSDQVVMSVFSDSKGRPNTVLARLGNYCASNVWAVSDGAAVARLPIVEVDHPAQVKRDVLTNLTKAVGEDGVVTLKALSDYVQQQRAESSDTWLDAVYLAMSKTVLDEEYICDYPFNTRLATSLSDSDWKLMNGAIPFPASALSPSAAEALRTLLIQSRSRMERPDSYGQNQGDPALWPSILLQNLRITPDEKKETVLIGIGPGGVPDVRTLAERARSYESRKREDGKEPMYKLAERTNLKLTISNATGSSVKTGFTEVNVAKGAKWSVWSALPGDLADQFKAAAAEYASRSKLSAPIHKP